MDNAMAHQRQRLPPNLTSNAINTTAIGPNCNNSEQSENFMETQYSTNVVDKPGLPTSSFGSLFDEFTARVTGERSHSRDANDQSDFADLSNTTAKETPLAGNSAVIGSSSITSLTSIGSTANAFYSSIGLAFNSLTSPISAAAAAATATTAEAAAVVVAAASAISNHLSSPTQPDSARGDIEDDEDDENNCYDDNTEPPTIQIPKKSWLEIKETISNIRKELSSLSCMVPTNIQFRNLSDGRVRCYFLSTPPNHWETTLLYADIAAKSITSALALDDSGEEFKKIKLPYSPTTALPTDSAIYSGQRFDNNRIKILQWNTALQHPISSIASSVGANNANLWSREFQLLQERKRLSPWGITSYELHKPSGQIIFPCMNDLYHCFDTGFNPNGLFPMKLRKNSQWAALDPQICPYNQQLMAYVSGCDIWILNLFSGHEERLTFTHDGQRSFADDPLSSGIPSYVMQEEFSRYQGYWWQPYTDDDIYRIVYEEVDESDVCVYTFPSAHTMPGEVEEYRFPRTGTPNAKSKLKMVQFVLNESMQISEITIKELPYSLSELMPWIEYIVRVGWTPNCKHIWVQAMNRKQQRLDLILIPIDNFCETSSGSTSSSNEPVDHSGKKISTCTPLQVIYTERSDMWINIHDLLYFLEITDYSATFIWASEETGYRHLYLVTSALTKSDNNPFYTSIAVDNHSDYCSSSSSSNTKGDQQMEVVITYNLQPRIISKIALTSGEWEVLNRNIWVNKEQQLVYFLGLRETPLEKHLYVVNLQQPEHIRQLTEPGYSYLVEFNDSCQLMLQVYCNIDNLPSSKIMCISQTCPNGGVNGIQLSLIGYLHKGGKVDPKYTPEIYSPQLPSGEIVYAMIFKPHNFQIGIKYPTVLNVYGGPEVQTVNNTFKGKHQLRMHMLASQGYCVICIDSRGSRHRGTQFENHIRCRMGQVELHDQVDALRMLSEQLGYIDMSRVAIHGWSYGGYLSLMGLVHYPNIFKVAIAGAPVTSWEYYDTGYTERYMDLPQNNKKGYNAGSVLNYVHAFPDEENRLLLIHGLVDENVHFYHTSKLINALNRANKPYTLHIFPDERHSLRNLESNKNYETKLLSFLQNL